jgi:hypothetical protein
MSLSQNKKIIYFFQLSGVAKFYILHLPLTGSSLIADVGDYICQAWPLAI